MAIFAKAIEVTGEGVQADVLLETSRYAKLTADGGLAVLMVNQTGGVSVKGEVLRAGTAPNSVRKIAVDIPDPIGVFLDSGVPNGSLAWVVVAGRAAVYFATATTVGYLARGFLSADNGYVAGQALCEQVPTSPFASDKHFYEIGHVLETRADAGLAMCIIHFN